MQKRRVQGLKSKEDVKKDPPRERETYAEDILVAINSWITGQENLNNFVNSKTGLLLSSMQKFEK